MRLVPFHRKISPQDEPVAIELVNTFTSDLTPGILQVFITNHYSLWQQLFTQRNREYIIEQAKPYQENIARLDDTVILEAILLARPDLYSIVVRDGGKEWLKHQVSEIQAALLGGY